MSLKNFIILMALGTFLSWLGWILVINFINPSTTGVAGFIFFYLSLFLASTGTIAVIGLLIRMRGRREKLITEEVGTAFRHGILFSILIVGLFFLQSQKFLTWWNIVLFIFVLTILEFFFISLKKKT